MYIVHKNMAPSAGHHSVSRETADYPGAKRPSDAKTDTALAHMRSVCFLFSLSSYSREVHVCLPVDGRMDNGIHTTIYIHPILHRSISRRRCRVHNNNTTTVWIIASTHDMPHIIMIISLDARAGSFFLSLSLFLSALVSLLSFLACRFSLLLNVRAFFCVLILILYLPIMLCVCFVTMLSHAAHICTYRVYIP